METITVMAAASLLNVAMGAVFVITSLDGTAKRDPVDTFAYFFGAIAIVIGLLGFVVSNL